MTTGIEQKNVFKRIKQNRTYNQERLKVLFGIIYRDPKTALEKWERLVAQSGFDKTFKKQRRKPAYLGKLKGKGFFGLYRSNERQKASHANEEFHKTARTWYGSVLEEEEVLRQENISEQQMTEEGNQKIIEQAKSSVKTQLEKMRQADNQTQDEHGDQF
jgi:hypothetical protein